MPVCALESYSAIAERRVLHGQQHPRPLGHHHAHDQSVRLPGHLLAVPVHC